MALTKEQLVDAIRSAVEPLPVVNAMWIGGSHAFGEDDEYSDLDIDIDAADGTQDEVYSAIETALERLSTGIRVLHVTEGQWPGHHKRIYRLPDAPEWLLIDMLVKERNRTAPPFNEREIHGEAIVVFDKLGVVDRVPTDRDQLREDIRKRIEQKRREFEMFAHYPAKELARGRYLDALWRYYSYVLAPLINVLRARYSPFRHDWGTRYFKRDLPAEVYQRLSALSFIADEEDLQAKVNEATAWAEQEFSEFDAGTISFE